MTAYFITGDRALDPITALSALGVAVTKHLKADDVVYTGSLRTGIERAVRYAFLDARVMNYSSTDDNRPDFTGLFEIVNADPDIDKVLFVHPDPLASRVGAALVATVAPDKLEMMF
jgi:hypothetical protein